MTRRAFLWLMAFVSAGVASARAQLTTPTKAPTWTARQGTDKDAEALAAAYNDSAVNFPITKAITWTAKQAATWLAAQAWIYTVLRDGVAVGFVTLEDWGPPESKALFQTLDPDGPTIKLFVSRLSLLSDPERVTVVKMMSRAVSDEVARRGYKSFQFYPLRNSLIGTIQTELSAAAMTVHAPAQYRDELPTYKCVVDTSKA